MKVTKYFLGLTCTMNIKNGNRNRFATAAKFCRLDPIVKLFIVMTSFAYATVTIGCKNGSFG